MNIVARGHASVGFAVAAVFRLAVLASRLLPRQVPPKRVERKSHAQMVIDFIDTFLEPRLADARRGQRDNCRPASTPIAPIRPASDLKPIEDSFAADREGMGRRRFRPLRSDHERASAGALLLLARSARHDGAPAHCCWQSAILRCCSPDSFAKQSVAVQGLSALEILIYDQNTKLGGTDEAGRYRCQFAIASAAGARPHFSTMS